MRSEKTVYTIGHSTRSVEDLISILKANGIERVADIRTIPRSKHNPQFNKEDLRLSLRKARIGYIHLKGLGGLRHPKKDSINTAWRNASFRGFADYMQTAEFEKNLLRLIKMAGKKKVAIMCAESVPWRCHRSLVADALTAHGVAARHIMSATNTRPHKLTGWARIKGHKVYYAGMTRTA